MQTLGKFNGAVGNYNAHYDWMAELFDALARCNTILIDPCRNMWGFDKQSNVK